MATNFTQYAILPSKEKPFGITHGEMHRLRIESGEELRRIYDAAKIPQDILSGAALMPNRGFYPVPEEMILRAVEELKKRIAIEKIERIAAAKTLVAKRIKSAMRLSIASRKATRNHVRGWA